MAGFRFISAVAAFAAGAFSAVLLAHAAPPDALVNKGDLGISLGGDLSNAAAKGDCDCAESLYGSAAGASAYQEGQDSDVPPLVVAPVAAPPELGNASVLSADIKRFACLADGEAHWVYTQQACDLLKGSKTPSPTPVKRKGLRRMAGLKHTHVPRRKTSRPTVCVFGAPNASGCP